MPSVSSTIVTEAIINPEPVQSLMSPLHQVPIQRYARVTSTPEIARGVLQRVNSAPKGLLIAADEQTGGRGTRGRGWQSPKGSLSVTLIALGPARPELGLLVGIAARDAICDELTSRGITLPHPLLRWPNDVVFDWHGERCKAGGCLTEWLEMDRQGVILASVGVNVNNPASGLGPDLRTPAVSLCEVAGRIIDPMALAGRLADGLLEATSAQLSGTLMARAEQMLAGIGQETGVRYAMGVKRDAIVGIAPDGGLRLRSAHGQEEIIRHSSELDEAVDLGAADNTAQW